MACCLSPSCCPGRRSARRPASKSSGRRSAGACLLGKSVTSPVAEPATPRTSAVVPDVVDRLRRRLCQDSGTDDDGRSTRGSPCQCCRRCLGDNEVRQAAGKEPDQSSLVPSTRVSPTPSKTLAVSGTTPGTTEVGSADFMTLFFRNCERIVLDNAAAIHEMLSVPTRDDEERRDNAGKWRDS